MASGLPDFLQSYEVVGKLREGGMGAIYRVRHRLLGQHRVVKILRPQLVGDSDFHTRFLREAQLVAELRHPNIALLYEFALAESGAGSIVMEFIDGVSLKDVLEGGHRLSLGLTLEILRQVLSALDYLHGGGVLHRDISPDNIMLTRDRDGAPLVKLIDLGIAKRLGEASANQITGTGTFLGKVRYASPEQFGLEPGDQLDARSDLYSLGIVLYELLTGSFPIRGDDSNSIIAGHLFHAPRTFADTDPEGLIPEDLRAVVLHAMAKDRRSRVASAAQFQEALEPMRRRYAVDRRELAGILAAAATAAPPPQPADSEDLSRALGTAAPAAATLQSSTLRGPSGGPTLRLDLEPGTALPPPSPPPPMAALPAKPRWRRAAPALAAAAAVAALVAWAATSWWPRERGMTEDETAILAQLAAGQAQALVIGNENYQRLPALRSAAADAQAVGDLLAARYGFSVTRLTDATRKQIVTALDGYRARLAAPDRLLVYYAGHGGQDYSATGEAIGYWLPVDSGLELDAQRIPNREVSDYLKALAARHILVLADSCYAGTIAEEQALRSAAADAEERGRQWRRLAGRSARLALSSGGEAPVLEPGAGTRSLFASALLGVLTENTELLPSADLFERMRQRMAVAARRQGIEQQPTFGGIPGVGHDGGEFFLAPAQLLEPHRGEAR